MSPFTLTRVFFKNSFIYCRFSFHYETTFSATRKLILSSLLKNKESHKCTRPRQTFFSHIKCYNFRMTYGYIRVSTDKQTIENQRFEINNFCNRSGIKIDGWIEETISGTKNYNKRQLGKLLNKVQKDDLIICSELSRLGRNLFMIMEILSICMNKECKIWTIKDNYRLGDDIQSKVLAFAFGLSAEIERNLISQRTKEALARKRAEGMKLGRITGSKNIKNKLSGREKEIAEMLNQKIPKSEIARKLKVDRSTLWRYFKTNGCSG